MHIPLTSVITLAAEIFISATVYFIIWRAYRTGAFMRRLAYGALLYEVIFNISYMAMRASGVGRAVAFTRNEIGLAVFHGVFSIIMFVTLVVFFLLASHRYGKGENFFKDHRRTTIAFAIAWGISILSGITFFVSLYII